MFFIEDDKMGFPVSLTPGNFKGLSLEFMVYRDFNGVVSPFAFSKEDLFCGFFECNNVNLCRSGPPAAVSFGNKWEVSVYGKMRDGLPAYSFIDMAGEGLKIDTDFIEYKSPLVYFKETLIWEDITEPEAEEFIFQCVKSHLAFIGVAFCDRGFTFYQAKINQHFKVFCQGVCLEPQSGCYITDFTFPISNDFKDGEVVDRFCNFLREDKERFSIEVSLFGQNQIFNISPEVFFGVNKFDIPWDTAGDGEKFQTFFWSKVGEKIFIIVELYRFKPYLCCPPSVKRALIAQGCLIHHVYEGTA